MASLPHTSPLSTSSSSYRSLGQALVGPSRDSGPRFVDRENRSTPPPSAVHHSFHPVQDIISGPGSPDRSQPNQTDSGGQFLEPEAHNRPQRGQAPSNGEAWEEEEKLPPGAFPNEEEKESHTGEEVKNAVDAIRDYAKTHLPAALGIYVGDTKEEDQRKDMGSPPTVPDSFTVSPEERESTGEGQLRSLGAYGVSHNTNPFRDSGFMQIYGSRAFQQSDIKRGDSMSDVSRMRMTSTEVHPTSTHPSDYTDEPSSWTSPYTDTFVPPTRTYDVVRDASAGQSQDVSSGFGGSIGKASLAEPVTTARAVPFIAEPPLVVYSPTSAPTQSETGGDEARPSGKATIISSLYEDPQRGTSRSSSSPTTPTISDQEQIVTRDGCVEGSEVEESQRERVTQPKQKPKGLLSKFNKLFLGKSSSKNGKPSKDKPTTSRSDSPRGESDTGQPPLTAAPVNAEDAGPVIPRSDTPPLISQNTARVRPVRIAETTTPPSLEHGHPQPTRFRRHALLDVIPKNVPAHFDETIGPLPRHVEMRGKRELPTKEKPGGSRVGVGSLPGRRDEAGVARLPDERNGIIATLGSRDYDERIPQTMDRENVRGVGIGVPSVSQASQQRLSTRGSPSPPAVSFNSAEQVSAPRNGFFSEFFSDAEEILRDIGDVAWYYVPGFGNSSERQPIPITREPMDQSSPSPSPVAANTPTRAPPSSPTVGTHPDARQAGSELPKVGCELPRSVRPILAAPPSTQESPTELLAESDPLATPRDQSSHPSRSSSAEGVSNEVFIVGPSSTRDRILGKQEYIASPFQREYVKFPTSEDHVAARAGGSLPYYPSETGLRALIGERMYDDQMRAVGAAEPEEATTSVLTNPLEVPREESTTTETRPVSSGGQTEPQSSVRSSSPVSVSATEGSTTKGLDVKSLGTPVGERQKLKHHSDTLSDSQKHRKSHN